MKNVKLFAYIVAFVLFTGNNTEAQKKVAKQHPDVLVIGLDGLGAHGIGMAKAPYLHELMKNGSYSLAARTVMPSSSGPAWSSMITGATVDRHGIGNNSWTVDNKVLEPVYKGDYNMFPTIFGEMRKNAPDAIIGTVYHWSSFGNFIEKGVCDLSLPADNEDIATTKAVEFISDKNPDFTFVHLDLIDHAGHGSGYRSEAYVKSVEKADSLVGVFINALKELKRLDNTVVFIVSDHGGLVTKHGGCTPDEMIVPLIIYGKGVKKGYEIKHPVFTCDLAPTVAWLYGFNLNEWVTGSAITDAFIK